MEIQIELTKEGGIRMLHSDEVDLDEFGEVQVERASHVEFSSGKGRCPGRGWYVQSAKTKEYLAAGFKTRQEALAWEKQHYSPTGAGWAELTKGGK